MAKEDRTPIHFDRDSLKFIGLDSELKKQIQETYKTIDVDAELKKIWQLHRVLANLGTKESTELLIDRIEKTPSNKDFLAMVGAKPADATASKSME
jgi:hypothetical protein